MAAGFRDSEKIGLGSQSDFTVSHRPPPPVPASPATTTSASTFTPVSPAIGAAYTTDDPASPPRRRPSQQSQLYPPLSRVKTGGIGNSDETASTTTGGRKRTGSFSFLRRTTSNSSAHSKHSEPAVYHGADQDAPPLPKTRIAQASAEAAAARQAQKQLRKTSTESDRKSSFTMLRKSSKLKKEALAQQEAERQAQAVPRQPPHLPSLTFGSDDVRPDSVAIFNNSYTHSAGQPRTTANFSRPSAATANNMAPPSSNIHSSSSPAYATRNGSGLTNSSSPPTRANGEYVVDPTPDRTESMTNRGRYSYASSVGQTVNVNSPRRVRRRKDPTPFK